MLGSFSPQRGRCASPPDTLSVQEPAMYHGKMCTTPENATQVDIILGVSAETIHAITIHKQKMMFQSPVALLKEIVWDHSEKSVHFVLDDGSSPTFVFPVLTELETHLSAIVELSDLEKPPDQVYIGVLIGQNLPSPIQQRRASLGFSQATMLPMSTRRELLRKEQPVRNATSRGRLGLEFMRSGYLCFTCSISGDLRGLTLEIHHMRIFPSPDCHDRSACLFSYAYEHLESCEVEGTRLELRFRTTHQLAKQPSYLVFQSMEAQYIREAIWYLKNGTYMDASLREMLASPGSLRTSSAKASDIAASRRANVLLFFADAESLKQRVDSCCRVIGCQNRVGCSDQSCSKPYEASASNVMAHINDGELSTMSPSVRTNASTSRVLTSGLCEFHASCFLSDSLPRHKSKPLLPAKSLQPLTCLLQSLHYTKMLKFQGQLQKRQKARTFHLRKAWHPKFVVLFETPVGGFLCYYDKLSHCPGMTETPKERRVIDLSSVLCIRPVSVASPLSRSTTSSTPTMHAFDVVTLYRTWTFAALEPEEYEVWLHVLTESVEKHATISPDKVQRFPVKLAMTGQTSPTEATSLEISSHGVSFCTGNEGEVVLNTWYYTDLEKWSVVFQQGYTCCLLRCRSPPPASPGSPRAGSGEMVIHDYLFRTTDASAVCLAIEFYVGKCMAKLEILAGQLLEDGRAQKSKTTIDSVVSKRGAVNPKVDLPGVKEHPIENVSLAPIGRSGDAMDTGELRHQEVSVDLDATTNETATEEPPAIALVEPKHQGADAEILLTMEEPVNDNCKNGATTASATLVEELTPVPSSVDERDASNSELQSIDLLEGMRAVHLRAPADVVLVSQLPDESGNAVTVGEHAALVEADAKMLQEMPERSCENVPSLSYNVPSSVLNDVESVNLPEGIRRRILRELERKFVNIQDDADPPNEDTTNLLDEKALESPRASSAALEAPPDLALECSLNECSAVSKCDETDFNSKRHRLVAELQANFRETEMNKKLVDALEGSRPDTFTPDEDPTNNGRDIESLEEVDDCPESTTAPTIPAPAPLLLLEYQSAWLGEQDAETNQTLTQQPTLRDDEDDDRSSECEVSDTFNSCASEVEPVSQDASSPPPPTTDFNDDEFKDAFEHEELPPEQMPPTTTITHEVISDNSKCS